MNKNKKTNIVELLKRKDVPTNYEFYTPLYPCEDGKSTNCTVEYVPEFGLRLHDSSKLDGPIQVNDYGEFYDGGECLLYPNKAIFTWELFDVPYTTWESVTKEDNSIKRKETIGKLLKDAGGKDTGAYDFSESNAIFYVSALDDVIRGVDKYGMEGQYIIKSGHLLTEASESKPVKIPDLASVVTTRNGETGLVAAIEGTCVKIDTSPFTNGVMLPCSSSIYARDLHEATHEEIDAWNKGLHKKGCHYSITKKKVVDWFHPGDPVVVRYYDNNEAHELPEDNTWTYNLFSHCVDGMYYTVGGPYRHCLPFNGTTRLLIGTTDDYDPAKEEL